jgi:5-methylcytosine-specific restriction protein A
MRKPPKAARLTAPTITPKRLSPSKRGYDSAWRAFRMHTLITEPLCRACRRRGKITPATDVDHITPLSKGGGRLDPYNVQPLCHSCHSRKTAKDDGGFGNGKTH